MKNDSPYLGLRLIRILGLGLSRVLGLGLVRVLGLGLIKVFWLGLIRAQAKAGGSGGRQAPKE